MTSKWLGGSTPRVTKRNDDDIFGLGISVAKGERELLKTSDKKTYYKIRESCVKGIENKFTQLKAIDENSPIDHFESVYLVVTRFDDLQQSLRSNDMLDVFIIGSEYELDGSGPSRTATEIDLFHNIKSVDINVIKMASQYFIEYGDTYHGENVIWSGEKILNSCDATLRDKLIESTRGWEPKHKGGPTYLKLLMGLIVATSEKSLRSLLDKVGSLKLTDFNGEDVAKAVSFLRGAILILRDNQALPSDFYTLLIKIFKNTTCDDFRSFVKLLEHNVELKLTTMTSDETLALFEKKYTDMLGRNEWTPNNTTTDQGSAFALADGVRKILCFNCGGIGHGVKDCRKPIDPKAIAIRKEIVLKDRSTAGSNPNSGSPRSSGSSSSFQSSNRRNNRGPSQGSGGSTSTSSSSSTSRGPSNPLKVPPKRDEPHEKSINGKKLHWCGKPGCCKWGDHKTNDHPTSNSGNPQGNIIEDIGDDSTRTTKATQPTGSAGYLGANSLSGF